MFNKLFPFLSLLDMTEFRQDPQAVVLDNKIYVISGRDFKGERVLDSVAREGFKCVTCKVSRNHLTPLKLK